MRVQADFIGMGGTYHFSAEDGERSIRACINTGLGITKVEIVFSTDWFNHDQAKAFDFANEMRDLILELAKKK